MSPEQACGKPLDTRSDVFSFGVTLYEALAGHLPFDGSTTLELMQSIIHAAPKPLGYTSPRLTGSGWKSAGKRSGGSISVHARAGHRFSQNREAVRGSCRKGSGAEARSGMALDTSGGTGSGLDRCSVPV